MLNIPLDTPGWVGKLWRPFFEHPAWLCLVGNLRTTADYPSRFMFSGEWPNIAAVPVPPGDGANVKGLV